MLIQKTREGTEMMGRIAGLTLGMAVLLTTTGCIDATTTIIVQKDGSGYVTESVYMSAAVE